MSREWSHAGEVLTCPWDKHGNLQPFSSTLDLLRAAWLTGDWSRGPRHYGRGFLPTAVSLSSRYCVPGTLGFACVMSLSTRHLL